MKCLSCAQENKPGVKICKKCGREIALAPAWFPDWKWHLKTLSIIYAALVLFFFGAHFLLKKLPPPYNLRSIPPEMTPWLNPKTPPNP
ncbi:MAG: hypothetical protein WC421_02175 [Elusimicrobiales bacterium]